MADRTTPRRLDGLRRAAPVVALAALLAGCAGGGDDDQGVVTGLKVSDDDGMHGAVLDQPYSVPDATLTTSTGDDVALHDGFAEADLTLVFFGYTNCPDICQAVMADLASAKARLADDDAERVQVWFVTTDPARDDAATVGEYVDRFDPDFEGLTGPLDTIVDVATAVHVPIEKGERLETGGYDVTHGTPILAVEPDGTVPMLWTEGTSAAKLAEDVATALGEGIPERQEG
ncbi:SCO family protein [Nocardioides caldifontis]|uniref:SCO family protein n=1 Tax=Nocardioides caldifontis TaxID=2588938 RepID=UPI0011DFA35F|nr:SCO family protein [Nocardioides caldifontis]